VDTAVVIVVAGLLFHVHPWAHHYTRAKLDASREAPRLTTLDDFDHLKTYTWDPYASAHVDAVLLPGRILFFDPDHGDLEESTESGIAAGEKLGAALSKRAASHD